MGKFINSNEYSLSKEQVASFFEEGYTIVPQLFTNQEISIIKSCGKSAYEIAKNNGQKYVVKNDIQIGKEFRFDYDSLDGHSSASILAIYNSREMLSIKLISWVGSIKPKLFEFGRHPKITNPVSQLLGSDIASHLINQLHYKVANDKVKFGWHQDIQYRRALDPKWQDVNRKGSFVQVITSVDDCTPTNGPLVIIPNSHRKDLFLEQAKSDEEILLRIENEYDLSQHKPLLLKAGDTLFMHPLLLHKSDANISSTDETRGLFINGFSFPKANNKKSYPGKGSCKEISLNVSSDLLAETNAFVSEIICSL